MILKMAPSCFFFEETSFSKSIDLLNFVLLSLKVILSGIFLRSFMHRDEAVSACEKFVSAVIVKLKFIFVCKGDD